MKRQRNNQKTGQEADTSQDEQCENIFSRPYRPGITEKENRLNNWFEPYINALSSLAEKLKKLIHHEIIQYN
jgi:N-formylglutamate amidohydrolase